MSESAFNQPPVHPFVECPNCRQLLELRAELCPRCREVIEPDYALLSAVVVHHNTQAISVAKTISTMDAFIPLAIIGSAIIFLIDWYSFGRARQSYALALWPSIPLIAIIFWYLRYGRFKIGDDEYLQARRDMRKSFCFWLAFLIVQVLVAAVW